MASVLSSRLLSAVAHLQSAFEEARGYAKYHPSRGYWWDFSKGKTSNNTTSSQLANVASGGSKDQNSSAVTSGSEKVTEGRRVKKASKNKDRNDDREEPSSIFQRRRVDMLLDLWMRNFPPKPQGSTAISTAPVSNINNPTTGNHYADSLS